MISLSLTHLDLCPICCRQWEEKEDKEVELFLRLVDNLLQVPNVLPAAETDAAIDANKYLNDLFLLHLKEVRPLAVLCSPIPPLQHGKATHWILIHNVYDYVEQRARRSDPHG